MDAESGRALRKASERGHEAVMRLLLENKANVNLAFPDSGEALQGISVDDHEAVLRLLLEGMMIASDKGEMDSTDEEDQCP